MPLPWAPISGGGPLRTNTQRMQGHGPFCGFAAHRKAPTGAPREGADVYVDLGHPEDETGPETLLRLARLGLPADPLENPPISQVNPYFRDLIQDSPHIAYRVGIFSAGLKDNPSVNLSLADKRRILCEYRTKWGALSPIQKSEGRTKNSPMTFRASASGVFCFVVGRDDFIQFSTLGSISRGIPRKEWRVPLPAGISLKHFAICPQADVLAVAGWGLSNAADLVLLIGFQPLLGAPPEHDDR